MNKNGILNRGTIHKLRDRMKVKQQQKITSKILKEHDKCHVDQSIVVCSSSNKSSQVVIALSLFWALWKKGMCGWWMGGVKPSEKSHN